MGNYRCIRPTFPKVEALSKKLGYSSAATAIKIEDWQDANNKGYSVIPTMFDMGMISLPWGKNIELYKSFKLLTNQGERKLFTKETATKFADSLNEKGYDYAAEPVKMSIDGSKWSVNLAKKLWTSRDGDSNQMSLFQEEEGIDYNSKILDFLGVPFTNSTDVLDKIANSDSGMSGIAKKLLKLDLNIPIEVISVPYFTKDNVPDSKFTKDLDDDFKGSAFFDPDENKIYVAAGTKRSPISLMLHEILHGYTANFIKNNPNNENVKNLNRLWLHLKNNKDNITKQYSIFDVDEVLTHVFTDSIFINDLKNLPATRSSFKNLWEEILQIFKNIFKIKDVSLFDEIFAVSSNIVEESMIADKSYSSGKVSFQQESESQATIYNDLLKNNITLSADNKTYIVNGESGFSRISTLIQKNRNLNNLTDTTAQTLGDVFHAIAANRIASSFPEYNKHFNGIPLEGVSEGTVINVHAIIDPIINKAKEEGSVLVTELPIASIKKKKAGTIDLLEITKDKGLKMLDYKTSMRSKNPTTKYKKFRGNSEQQEHYKEMIEETLQEKKKKVDFQELLYVKASTKNGISYTVSERLPVLAQTSKNKKINTMLSSLFKQVEKLVSTRNKNNSDKIDRLIAAKTSLMSKLQQDISNEEILRNAFSDLAAIESALSLSDDIDANYRDFKNDLITYSELNKYIKTDNSKDEAMIKEIVGRASLLYQELNDKVQNKLVQNVFQDLSFKGSPIETEDDVLKPIKDTNVFQGFALGASYSEVPIIASMYRQVQERLAIGRNKARTLGSKLQKLVSDLQTFTGKTGEDMYSMFLQTVKGKKTGYLIREFKGEFYIEAKEAISKGDVSWFSENATFDNEKYLLAKSRQQEMLENSTSEVARKLAYIKSSEKYADLTNEKQQELAEKFVKEDNVKYLQEWVKDNKTITKFYKPKLKWRDSKWVDIKEGKYKGTVVEEFYDLYTYVMEEIEDGGLPFDISENFIPEFKKDLLSKVINNGIGSLKLGESLIDSITINFDEAEVNKVDPFTKELIKSIPVLGKRKFDPNNTRENFVQKDKSYDLGYSLAVFYESAVRYQELKSIETTLEIAKNVLQEQEKTITNVVGEEVKEGYGNVKLSKNLENEIKRFENFIDTTVYGKTIGKETGVKVTGNGITEALGLIPKGTEKIISWSKSKDILLKYTGLNNIGFNLYSPVTNILGGKSMQLLMGVGGKWYSSKNYGFASLVVTAGPFSELNEDVIKANKFVEMLNVEINEFVKDEFNKIRSENKLLHKIPGPYSLMQWTEAHLHKAGLIAMIKSNKHSIKWDDWKLVKGELQYTGEEQMSEGVKESFRQKVLHVNGRALGNMNPDDKILLKKWFLGRAVMQHRGWMPAMIQSHFGKRQYDYQLQEYIEGRFVSLTKFIFTKSLNWSKLDDIEKANVKESVAEFSILAAATLLLSALKGDDDDEERRKRLAYVIRVTDRYVAEMGFFTPFEIEGKGQILISPAPAVSTVQSVGRMFNNFGTLIFGDEESSEKARKKLGKSVTRTIPIYSQGERFINEALQIQIENED
jgi:hypothetical protein